MVREIAGRSWLRYLIVLAAAGLVATFLAFRPSGPGKVTISITGHRTFAAGAAEKIRVTMNSDHGAPLWRFVSWGDGRKNDNSFAFTFRGPCYQPLPVGGGTPPPLVVPKASTLPPGQNYIELLHRYRKPGTYRVTVQADEFRLCNQHSPTGTASILLHVTGPAAPGNGPADPQPILGIYDYFNDLLTASVGASDFDGYVPSVSVTWLNGSTRVYRNPDPCRDYPNAWPSSDFGFKFTTHVKPGIYYVKMTVVSTDCQGGSPQMITMVERFHLQTFGSRVYRSRAIFTPHDPRNNGDSTLPAGPTSYGPLPSGSPP